MKAEEYRRFISIVKTTALEVLSEPLSLLILLASLTLTVLAPAFHYHQFGEATRMARDAGFSSLLIGGGILAAFGTIRAFRREIESGTLGMALAHPIGRSGFFLAKTAGAFLAYVVFATVVFLTSVVIVEGASIGGLLAKKSGDVAQLWGPSLAAGLAVIVLPLVAAAVLNRFARFRFVLTSFVLAALLSFVFSLAALAYHDAALVFRMVAVAEPIVVLTAVVLTAAAAFAVRWKANAAASGVGGLCILLVPVFGNYYLSDALSNGGCVSWSYVGLATLAALPAVLLFALAGIRFIDGREVS